MNAIYAVALVADPEFGVSLLSLAERMHVWVIESPTNLAVAKTWWANHLDHSQTSGITTYRHDPGEDLESWSNFAIESLDEHHGPLSGQPAYSEVNVFGLSLSAKVRESFENLGFIEFHENANGFIAKKVGA